MRLKNIALTEIEPKKKIQERRKKWRIVGIIICTLILLCVVGQIVVDHTIGRFPDLYDAIAFSNDFKQEDITNIIYGDTTATVIYKTASGNGIQCYYQEDGLWAYTGLRIQDVEVGKNSLSILKTKKGDDWSVRVLVRTRDSKNSIDIITDCYDTNFYQYSSNELLRSYFAYIEPESSLYTITVNGETYELNLKNFNVF